MITLKWLDETGDTETVTADVDVVAAFFEKALAQGRMVYYDQPKPGKAVRSYDEVPATVEVLYARLPMVGG